MAKKDWEKIDLGPDHGSIAEYTMRKGKHICVMWVYKTWNDEVSLFDENNEEERFPNARTAEKAARKYLDELCRNDD